MLPEYTGATDSDRAEYLRANSHELATEAVTSARQQRAEQLINDPDSVMDAVRAKRSASDQLADVSIDFEVELENRFCETIPEAAVFLSGIQRADEMAATREERVGAIVDEVYDENQFDAVDDIKDY